MKGLRKWAILLCALPLFFTACGGGGGSDSGGSVPSLTSSSNLVLNLTDNPGNYLSVLVTITGIYAIVDDSDPIRLDFADFNSPAIVDQTPSGVTVDLLQLANKEPIEFAFGELPPGNLSQLRLVVSEASLTAYEDVVGIDGDDDGEIDHEIAEYPVKVPSGSQSGIKLNPQDVKIQTGSLTALTLDFDAEKSIVQLGGSENSKREFDFILKPVIFILEATGTIRVNTETTAVGLNFPTGLQVVENPGPDSVVGDGSVLVANAGTSDTNSNTVLDIDVSGTIPVDATTLTPFASSADLHDGTPLVDSPSGVAQYMDLVWISNAISVGTVSELYTNQDFGDLFTDNTSPSVSVAGLVLTSNVEFGGFAPNGSLSGDDLLVFETNENGSVTGLNFTNHEIFDVLGAGSFANPSDLAFVPSSTPIQLGDAPGTFIGTLYVTDASTDEIAIVSLTTAGGNVGDAATSISAVIEGQFTGTFVFNPVGIAYSAESGRLYIANRANGSITAVQLDGTEIETYDTGLGENSINGIDVISDGTQDILFLTNTAGSDDSSNAVGVGTLEKVVIVLP